MWTNLCNSDCLTDSFAYILGTILFNRGVRDWPYPQLNRESAPILLMVFMLRLKQREHSDLLILNKKSRNSCGWRFSLSASRIACRPSVDTGSCVTYFIAQSLLRDDTTI